VHDPAEVVESFINAFIEAWPHGEAARLAAFFAEGAIYHNVPLEPAVGRDAIVDTFAQFMALGGTVRVELRHLLSDDKVVMTERVDHFVGVDRTIDLPMMGICEVQEGLITAWRDYFDLNQLGS
jgi:limonene-1,2-epoxide hydrolase